jgi:YVTN family beta-propeller protein
VVVSPDGTTVYTANTGDDSVGVADPKTGLASAQIFLPPGALPYFQTFAPNGKTLYVSNFNNAVVPPFGGLESISVITGF